ncbi:MAG: toxin-antitoxin system YwqK family antitoxin [Alphaproteobacteria bacterium]|nr:toxin-antitoxin system YwqK family antitoxin [Alphaproteobacteria bacterium]
MLLRSFFVLLLVASITNNAIAKDITPPTTNGTKLHLLKNTKCRYRKKDRTTYCVDKNNTKITGELRKYESGKVIRSLHAKNGLLEGTAKAVETNGDKIYEKTYVKGQLHGPSITYHPENKIQSVIPYVKGKKEGIAKYYYPSGNPHVQCTYVEDKLDGQMLTYDENGKTIYDVVTANDKFVIGSCSYIDEKNEIKTKEIPQILLDAINANCINMGNTIMKSCCSFDDSDELSNCNKTWLSQHKEQLEAYTTDCKLRQE